MALNLARNWWALALRGVAAIIFGVIALFWPPTAIIALVAIFGAYALVDGILNLVAAVRAGRTGQRWGALVFEAIVSLAVGILTLFFPGVTALALVLLVAAWSLVTGVAEVVAAIKLRKVIQGEWLLALSGILSIAFGVLLFISPLIGAIAIAIWIGAYSLVFGALLVGLALRLRSWAARQQETNIPAAPVPRPA
ncbi:MAG TPA: HdeD family acid-resistance protein [Myxococcales bacterium]